MTGDVRMFRFRTWAETGTNANFERDSALDDQPNASSRIAFDGQCVGPNHVHQGIMTRIHIRLIPTNVVTYQFALYGCRNGATGTNQLESDKIFDSTWQVGGSPDPLVRDTEYVWDCLCIPFCLCRLSEVFFNINWSAAPGDTTGYLEVWGRREAVDT